MFTFVSQASSKCKHSYYDLEMVNVEDRWASRQIVTKQTSVSGAIGNAVSSKRKLKFVTIMSFAIAI